MPLEVTSVAFIAPVLAEIKESPPKQYQVR